MPEKSENPHKNHRSRFKKRFLQSGLSGFDDHQALELLLYYCYPRIDTNVLAHEYLNKYGSLSNLFEADAADLQTTLGVTENVAVLLTLIPQLSQKYMESKWSERPKLVTVQTAGKYCVALYHGKKYEVFSLLCFDINKRLIASAPVSEGTVNEAFISPRKVVEVAIRFQAVSIILVHNHPGGTLSPSSADIETTNRLSGILSSIGIILSDHIIVCGDKFFSFVQKGLLD